MSAPSGKTGCRLWFRRAFRVFGALFLLCLLAAGALTLYLNPDCERENGVVYGQRDGRDLTFDLVRPKRPNGLGVLLMVSGSWKSKPSSFGVWMAAPLLRSGYTVFAVSHVSQPHAAVQDTVRDVNRAVRFIRFHAADYGIDPDRIGVTGGSSGGHLCLMLATRGGPGPPDAPDPVDRESSAVQAVAVFFPVSNLVDLGASRENAHDGGPPKSFRKAFGPNGADREKWRSIGGEISPVLHVHAGQPPVLSIHGDADTLVPLEQSEWFRDASAKAGAPEVKIVVRRGKNHGWLTLPLDVRLFARWFDAHLKNAKPPPRSPGGGGSNV
ncbi:MAG: alpha/beta hydrolase [Verrucomicrobiae bacterium]|nr:alpha/beta hydrolase [Verrucomicrobiae bacterium]MCP5539932.1 alpha/beta hydrolase [Akkermansiaceae bacterium]MCP5551372.1 alpha/beta hydrolase [Akkermansiaceae bacterium]